MKAECPICKRSWSVKAGGKIRLHRQVRGWKYCSGSNMKVEEMSEQGQPQQERKYLYDDGQYNSAELQQQERQAGGHCLHQERHWDEGAADGMGSEVCSDCGFCPNEEQRFYGFWSGWEARGVADARRQ